MVFCSFSGVIPFLIPCLSNHQVFQYLQQNLGSLQSEINLVHSFGHVTQQGSAQPGSRFFHRSIAGFSCGFTKQTAPTAKPRPTSSVLSRPVAPRPGGPVASGRLGVADLQGLRLRLGFRERRLSPERSCGAVWSGLRSFEARGAVFWFL